MGSRSPQQPWPPYPALKDCSQGYCSYYCPQWCYFLFPTPPPPTPPNSHTLSPLLIAVISIVSTAFLLTAYYLILSKFRRHFHSPPPPHNTSTTSTTSPAASHGGLDDTLISKLASCQYLPDAGAAGGIVPDGADCSVCLAPFQERDLLRLLPTCDHAFHARCIDVWLRAHSTCPLCRAGILPVPHPTTANPQAGRTDLDETPAAVVEEPYVDAIENNIGELGSTGRLGAAGRSLSMDSSPFRRQQLANTADVNDAGSSSSSSRWTRALHCVVSPVRMKRSLSSSSGFTRRGRSTMLPI